MDNLRRDQMFTQAPLEARLQADWEESEAHRDLERPPLRQWPLFGRPFARLVAGMLVTLIVIALIAVFLLFVR